MGLHGFYRQSIHMISKLIRIASMYSAFYYVSLGSPIKTTDLNTKYLPNIGPISNSMYSNIKYELADRLNNSNIITDSITILNSKNKKSIEEEHNQMSNNNKYLISKTKKIYGFSSQSYKTLTDTIDNMLSNVKHNHRIKDPAIIELNFLEKDITLEQKLRIYVMLNALQDTTFCNTIGELISKDVTDTNSEHGGIVKFDNYNKIQLKNIPNNLPERTNIDTTLSLHRLKNYDGDNNSYYIDKAKIKSPFIALYHFHAATYNEANFTGPSSDDFPNYKLKYDDCAVHELVITSITKGKFNVDYYGASPSKNKTINTTIKAVDLGTYNYNPK